MSQWNSNHNGISQRFHISPKHAPNVPHRPSSPGRRPPCNCPPDCRSLCPICCPLGNHPNNGNKHIPSHGTNGPGSPGQEDGKSQGIQPHRGAEDGDGGTDEAAGRGGIQPILGEPAVLLRTGQEGRLYVKFRTYIQLLPFACTNTNAPMISHYCHISIPFAQTTKQRDTIPFTRG